MRIKDELPSGVQIIKRIGKGGFSRVYLTECRRHGNTRQFAVMKVISKHYPDSRDPIFIRGLIMHEIRVLEIASQHHQSVRLIEWRETPSYVYLFYEYTRAYIDLYEYTNSNRYYQPTIIEIGQIINQVVDALLYLESQHIIHRDIKPENILIHRVTRQIKLCDYGASRFNQLRPGFHFTATPELSPVLFGQIDELLRKSILGTLAHMPPEISYRYPPTHKSDVWSLGVVFYELLYARQPFEKITQNATYDCIRSGRYEWPRRLDKSVINQLLPGIVYELGVVPDPITIVHVRPHISGEGTITLDTRILAPRSYLDLAQDLISHMLLLNLHDRYSLIDCKNHPYLLSTRPPS